MASVVTASKDQVDWAIGVLDKAGEGEPVEAEEFFKATAVLTVVATAAFDLAEEVERLRKEVNALENKEMNTYLDRELENGRLRAEVERLRLSFAFQCSIGNLSLAQVATALGISQAEVKELMRKLPERGE